MKRQWTNGLVLMLLLAGCKSESPPAVAPPATPTAGAQKPAEDPSADKKDWGVPGNALTTNDTPAPPEDENPFKPVEPAAATSPAKTGQANSGASPFEPATPAEPKPSMGAVAESVGRVLERGLQTPGEGRPSRAFLGAFGRAVTKSLSGASEPAKESPPESKPNE